MSWDTVLRYAIALFIASLALLPIASIYGDGCVWVLDTDIAMVELYNDSYLITDYLEGEVEVCIHDINSSHSVVELRYGNTAVMKLVVDKGSNYGYVDGRELGFNPFYIYSYRADHYLGKPLKLRYIERYAFEEASSINSSTQRFRYEIRGVVSIESIDSIELAIPKKYIYGKPVYSYTELPLMEVIARGRYPIAISMYIPREYLSKNFLEILNRSIAGVYIWCNIPPKNLEEIEIAIAEPLTITKQNPLPWQPLIAITITITGIIAFLAIHRKHQPPQ